MFKSCRLRLRFSNFFLNFFLPQGTLRNLNNFYHWHLRRTLLILNLSHLQFTTPAMTTFGFLFVFPFLLEVFKLYCPKALIERSLWSGDRLGGGERAMTQRSRRAGHIKSRKQALLSLVSPRTATRGELGDFHFTFNKTKKRRIIGKFFVLELIP